MTAKVLMVLGKSSMAGKSQFVAALCRISACRSRRTVPFKAQKISNNAAVCPDGSEIARSMAQEPVVMILDEYATFLEWPNRLLC